jgi:hypothetical protein
MTYHPNAKSALCRAQIWLGRFAFARSEAEARTCWEKIEELRPLFDRAYEPIRAGIPVPPHSQDRYVVRREASTLERRKRMRAEVAAAGMTMKEFMA